MMSVFRNNDSDNLFQWQFDVECGGDLLCIIGSNSRIEFLSYSRLRLTKADISAIDAALAIELRSVRRLIEKARDALEHWSVFINPFARVEDVVASLLNELTDLDLAKPEFPRKLMFDTQKEVDAHVEALKTWTKRQHRAAVLGTAIRSLAPVMAEAFINLLFFFLARPDVRADQRLYDGFLRSQVDVRARGLHLNCTGFRCAVDSGSKAFKDFQTLMNSRNDVLHGNVDPGRLKIGSVWFDGTVPLFSDQRPFMERVTSQWTENVAVENASRDVEVVSVFIAHVLGVLDDDIRALMRNVMFAETLGYRPDTRRAGLLFSSDLVADIMVLATADTKPRTTPETQG